jgi:peptidoglycan hydrolase-like protein with peptidoglycan-binding domain
MSTARRKMLAAGTALVLGGAAAGTVLLVRDDSAAASGETGPAFETATAERRTLTDSDTVSGTLGYADPRTVTAATVGTVTALPAEGSTVGRGKGLYRIDDQPVTLLYGTLPLYRDLAKGVDDGNDIEQLERNLEALGYDAGTVDNTFSSATEDAVKELQDDLGVEATGRVTSARFVVLPGALRVGAHQAAVGDRTQPGGAVYEATATTRVVTVDLDAGKSMLAVAGAKATVTLPDGRTTRATIHEVGTAAEATDSSTDQPGGDQDASAEATIPLTLRLDDQKAAGTLSSAPVTVDLTREQKRNVVTVPITALVALAEGGYAVRIPDATQPSGHRLVGVQTGMYASGRVEITQGLRAGQVVAVPQ